MCARNVSQTINQRILSLRERLHYECFNGVMIYNMFKLVTHLSSNMISYSWIIWLWFLNMIIRFQQKPGLQLHKKKNLSQNCQTDKFLRCLNCRFGRPENSTRINLLFKMPPPQGSHFSSTFSLSVHVLPQLINQLFETGSHWHYTLINKSFNQYEDSLSNGFHWKSYIDLAFWRSRVKVQAE